MFSSLSPRLRVQLSSPELPGALWTAVLGEFGTTTVVTLVLEETPISVKLNWSSPPASAPSHIEVGLGGSRFQRIGTVESADALYLPAYLTPFPRQFRAHLIGADGKVVGQVFRRSMRQVSDHQYEFDVDSTITAKGRVVDETGGPVPGARVIGSRLMPEPNTVTREDGTFALTVNPRFDFPLVITHGSSCADVTIPAGTREIGDIILRRTRTIRVSITGDRNNDRWYFLSASDVYRVSTWPAPVACRVGESVDVPVRVHSPALIARSSNHEIVEPLAADTRELTIDVGNEGTSATLKASLNDPSAGTIVSFAEARFKVGPAALSYMVHTGQAGSIYYVTTDQNGTAKISGLVKGEVYVELISPRVVDYLVPGGPFQLNKDGQILEFQLLRRQRQSETVSVTGRISPVPETPTLSLVGLDQPLPRPMTGREIEESGIRMSIITNVHVVAGAYSARMDVNFPYIAVRVDDGQDLCDNAGYLTRIGDTWRADLVVPPAPDDRAMAEIEIDSAGASITSQRVKVLWTIDGSLRSHDKHATQGKPIEIAWPRGATRVWVVATATSDGRRLAGMLEPREGSTHTLTLEPMPDITVINAEGSGWLALTPVGMNERDWTSLASAKAGGLPLFGAGQYELAGMDKDGRVRTQSVTITSSKQTLQLDASIVLSDP